MPNSESVIRVNVSAIRNLILGLLKAVNVRDDVAQIVTEGLLCASIRGVDSHGIRLLPHYITAVEGGRINPNPHFKFDRTGLATGVLDADHTFGHASGIEAIHHAVSVAQEAGAALVGVYNSSHNGALAYYTLEAAKNDFIGLAFTHADALLNTFGSIRPFFGTNPISVAVPCKDEEPFCYDGALSLISWNKLLELRQKNLETPSLSGVDAYGNATVDPHKITQLLPIGGYKGFGLAMFVDILCGLLTGMPVGRDIPDMYNTPLSQRRCLGQFYMIIKIDVFQPIDIFKARMKKLMDDIRNEPRKNKDIPIVVAGDPEKYNAIERMKNGIPLTDYDLKAFKRLANKYQIEFVL